MTDSELHALMTSGFATVAGSIVAAYVEFGVSATTDVNGFAKEIDQKDNLTYIGLCL